MSRMDIIKINSVFLKKFRIRDLSVKAELFGLIHEFEFEGLKIRVILPGSDKVPDDESYWDGELRLTSWKKEDGAIIPREAEVSTITIEVDIVEKNNIPQTVLAEGFKSREIYTEQQKKTFSTLSNKYIGITERAFNLWVRTLRWKCWDGDIGRPEISGSETNEDIIFKEKETNKCFWIHSPGGRLLIKKAIDITDWIEVEKSLINGTHPPVFIDLFFDAIEHLKMKDYQRATIDAAVVCETLMRIEVIKSLPDNLSEAIRKFIDEANIRQVVTKFFPDILPEEKKQRFKKIESKLHKLFDNRNRILHSGYLDELSKGECEKHINTASDLIAIMDENDDEQLGKKKTGRVEGVLVIGEH